tara:strand:+ start:95 stop:337 length:243 start_codon:yes stop_codon:yes gene_type:complete
METIIDYVMRLEMEKEIDAVELWSKWNIQNYLSNPEESKDKNYSKKQQKIRKLIRAEDVKVKKDGGVIDWGYLLNASDSF